MKLLPHIFLVALLSAGTNALAQQTEKSVAFLTAEKKYITAGLTSTLDLSGVKIASKQVFTLIDMNGGELADGDEVQIRYTPNKPGEAIKPNYWNEKSGALKRGAAAGLFKLKKMEATYAFQAPGGKFIAAPVADAGALTLADSADAALRVQIMDTPAIASGAAKASPSPAAEKPAAD